MLNQPARLFEGSASNDDVTTLDGLSYEHFRWIRVRHDSPLLLTADGHISECRIFRLLRLTSGSFGRPFRDVPFLHPVMLQQD
jgi:hypothetical protein